MSKSGRSRMVLALVLAFTGATSGSLVAASDPEAEPPSELFVMPAPDATWSSAVNDDPAEPLETIDLQPVIDAADGTVAGLAPEEWEVDAMAATISDPVAAFELIRDAIGFDPYAGVLRGAHGTLAARAGNSYDRAVLLKALLDAQGATSRFAFGRLSPETASRLVSRGLDAPVRPLSAAGASPFDPAFEAAVDLRARRDYGLLLAALGSRVAELSADGTAAAMADLIPHAWVQLQTPDGSWLDLDPSFPDARPGQTLTAAEVTQAEVSLADQDVVTLRLIAEMLQDGELSRSTVLEATLDSASAALQQILIAFQPAGTGGSLLGGGTSGVLGGGGGTGAYEPLLVIDGDSWIGDTISVSADDGGGGLFGGGSTQDLASISLEVEVSVPGLPPRSAERVIVDRVPAGLRAAGAVNPEDLLPVLDAQGTPGVFDQILHVMVSSGSTDARSAAARQGYAARVSAWLANAPEALGDTRLDVAFAPFAVTDETLVVASEQRLIPALADAEVRAFIAAPRVYLVSERVDAADPARRIIETDLAIDGVRTLPRTGASEEAAAAHQLWYGVVQGAIESELGVLRAASLAPEGRTLEGVSFDMREPLTVVTSADGAGPATADPSLAAILHGGGVAIVPGDVVGATTWWEVTADGSTRSVIAPSLGGVNWGGFFGALKRRFVPPVVGPVEIGDRKAGNEYQLSKETGEAATSTVSRAGGQAVRDTFESAGESVARALAKKTIGG